MAMIEPSTLQDDEATTLPPPETAPEGQRRLKHNWERVWFSKIWKNTKGTLDNDISGQYLSNIRYAENYGTFLRIEMPSGQNAT